MNIVIWVADSLRADQLGVFGCGEGASANIDALARDGVAFEHAYAQATWTKPSAGTLFTGMYPVIHGARSFSHGLRPDIPRLPVMLGEAGIATGVFSAIGHVAATGGFDLGVDHFVQLWEKEPYASGQRSVKFITATEVREEAERWMALQIAKRGLFFALLWTIDTHVPFETDRVLQHFPDLKTVDGSFNIDSIQGIWAASQKDHLAAIRKAYRAAIIDTDAAIGRLIAFLKRQGVYDDTLIVILGDHGEIFNEYSRGQHSPFRRLFDLVDRLPGIRKYPRRYRLTNRFGWLGHLNALPYDLLLRVPLLIKFPEGLWRGRREPGTVQLIDLAPTILDLIGDQGNASQMLGRSILPVLRGELDSTAEYTFSDSQTHLDRVRYISVQQGDWKLIRTIHPKAANYVSFWRRLKDVAAWQHWLTPEEILVNISDEKVDHQTDRPDVYAHLNEALDAWLLSNERLASQRGLLPAEEQKLLDHLADLGYL